MNGSNKEINGLTISAKMKIFGIAVFVVILSVSIYKYNMVTNADESFDVYSAKAVEGKFLVLEIEKELYYIGQTTRDIMLGNSFDTNILKIEKSRAIIVKAFENLRQATKDTLNENKKMAQLDDSIKKTLAYLDDEYQKMKSLKNVDRTPEALALMYQSYIKDTVLLENISHEAFKKIIEIKGNGLKIQTKEYHDEIYGLINFIFVESLVLLVLIMGYLFILTRNITSSLDGFKKGLTSFFDFLDKKSKTVEPISIASKDEFGQMAYLVNKNIQKIQENLIEEQKLIDEASVVIERVKHGWYSQLIETQTSSETLNILKIGINGMISATKAHFVVINKILEEYSNYKYTTKLEIVGIEKKGVFEIFVNEINKVRNAINSMLQESKSNGLVLDQSATTLLVNVTTLDKSSNETAAQLEETAAALEEVTGTIKSSSDKMSQMEIISKNVTESANNGEQLALKTATSMKEINEKVTAISEAINVIDQIAFQTNILSLNAAVEAATAGEAGKGFAVVAAEVRNLASRSAEAAKEIKELVEDANSKATLGKNISDEMIKGYVDLNLDIKKTIDLIADITLSSQEQKIGVEQINNAVNSLDKQTQENAAIARIVNDIAQNTLTIAKDILKNASEKEFIEKPSLKNEQKEYIEKPSFNNEQNKNKAILEKKQVKTKQVQPKQVEIKEIKSIVQSDDTWETF